MNQTELISAVAERAGLSKADAGKALEALVGIAGKCRCAAGSAGSRRFLRRLRKLFSPVGSDPFTQVWVRHGGAQYRHVSRFSCR